MILEALIIREIHKVERFKSYSLGIAHHSHLKIKAAANSTPTATIPSHMKAWAYSEHGTSKEILKFDPKFPTSELNQDQVLIKVAAAALNAIDYVKIGGRYKDSDASFPDRGSLKKIGLADAICGVYVLRSASPITSPIHSTTLPISNIWHCRLGHPSDSVLFHLQKDSLIDTNPKFSKHIVMELV